MATPTTWAGEVADESGASSAGSQISTWVVGAMNGGVRQPAGTTRCSSWALFDGSTTEAKGNPQMVDPWTGQAGQLYFRTCDGIYQYVFVGPTSPRDVARAAYQQAAAMLPRPHVEMAPPADKLIVGLEAWMAVQAMGPVSATASIPGLSATVTATPTRIEWSTGSRVAGDTTLITCALWGSTTGPGCRWTPAFPSVDRATGTTDLRYHGSVTVVWSVSWQATNGAGGTLADLHTTTPTPMTVQEIQTIGDG